MNDITVSFDQMQAVRIDNGLKLKAEPRPGPSTGVNRCTGCKAYQNPSGGCYITLSSLLHRTASTDLPRFCMAADRKDGLNIIWRPI